MMATNAYHWPTTTPPARQRGAVLAVSLIFLLILTLIGITAMSDTVLQEKMAGNLRDSEIAFQAGESALRDAEDLILSWLTQPEAKTTTGCSAPQATNCPLWDPATYDFETADQSTWNTVGIEYGDNTHEITTAVEDPKFVIEERQEILDSSVVGFTPPTSRVYYRVTARAKGGSGNAVSVIQTSVAKRFN